MPITQNSQRLAIIQAHKQSRQALGEQSWGGISSSDGIEALVSRFGRVAYGLADRSYRIAAIGNGQVPRTHATAFLELQRRLINLPR